MSVEYGKGGRGGTPLNRDKERRQLPTGKDGAWGNGGSGGVQMPSGVSISKPQHGLSSPTKILQKGGKLARRDLARTNFRSFII